MFFLFVPAHDGGCRCAFARLQPSHCNESNPMALHIKGEAAPKLSSKTESPLKPQAAPAKSHNDPLLERVVHLISHDSGIPKAIDLLRAANANPTTKNALAVCLMRAGQVDEAVRILRSLTLNPGSTWERADVPSLYKRNFATALLMSGLPAGCLSVIRTLPDATHPRCQEIEADVRAWARSLPFWKRWDWRLNQVEPKNAVIPLSFVPGELETPRG